MTNHQPPLVTADVSGDARYFCPRRRPSRIAPTEQLTNSRFVRDPRGLSRTL